MFLQFGIKNNTLIKQIYDIYSYSYIISSFLNNLFAFDHLFKKKLLLKYDSIISTFASNDTSKFSNSCLSNNNNYDSNIIDLILFYIVKYEKIIECNIR